MCRSATLPLMIAALGLPVFWSDVTLTAADLFPSN